MYSDALLTASIAGTVSVLATVLTQSVALRLSMRAQKISELQLQRHLTEKLYDLRLQAYPHAFEVTDRLRADALLAVADSSDYFHSVRDALGVWFAQTAFLLSPASLRSYYDLRDSLARVTVPPYSDDEIMQVWVGKRVFRETLRDDVYLLYSEERAPQVN